MTFTIEDLTTDSNNEEIWKVAKHYSKEALHLETYDIYQSIVIHLIQALTRASTLGYETEKGPWLPFFRTILRRSAMKSIRRRVALTHMKTNYSIRDYNVCYEEQDTAEIVELREHVELLPAELREVVMFVLETSKSPGEFPGPKSSRTYYRQYEKALKALKGQLSVSD